MNHLKVFWLLFEICKKKFSGKITLFPNQIIKSENNEAKDTPTIAIHCSVCELFFYPVRPVHSYSGAI